MADNFESSEIKIVSITPEINIPISLMNLADAIQNGKHGEVKNITIVWDNGKTVHHFGDISDEVATKNAHWNLSVGIQRIQMLSLGNQEED